jgi:hypothetical protein
MDMDEDHRNTVINDQTYHQDYTDMLSLIWKWNSTDKFNRGNFPVKHVKGEDSGYLFQIGKLIIEKIQKLSKSSYKIIDIKNTNKFETGDQLRYVFDMVLQKETPTVSKDKIIITFSVLEDKIYYDHNLLNKHNQIRSKERDNLAQTEIIVDKGVDRVPLTIESMTVRGYLRQDSLFYNDISGPVDYKQYYAFEDMEMDKMLSTDYVEEQLYKHKILQNKETDPCNILINQDCKGFYDDAYYTKEDKKCKEVDYNIDLPMSICTSFGTEMVEK